MSDFDMRWTPVILLLPLAVLQSGCGESNCLAACLGTISASGTVQVSASALEGGHATLCAGTRCTTVPVAPPGVPVQYDAAFTSFAATAIGPNATRVSASFATGSAADGDRFRLFLQNAMGDVLYATEQSLVLRHHTVCRMSCRSAKVTLDPSGQPGLCPNRECQPGFSLTTTLGLTASQLESSLLSVCLASQCGELLLTNVAAVQDHAEIPYARELSGALPGKVDLEFFSGFRLNVSVSLASDQLRDGDVWRVTVTSTASVPAFAYEQAVVYEKTYPNGKACDANPCLRHDVQL